MHHRIREVAIRYKGRSRFAPFGRPQDVAKFVRDLVDGDAREHFVVLHLDGRHCPVSYQIVSVGTATAALIHPREIFQAAVSVGACALIVAHNHPSGDPSPSAQDKSMTRRLSIAGDLLGIPLLDNVIVGVGGYYSTREEEPEALKLKANYEEEPK